MVEAALAQFYLKQILKSLIPTIVALHTSSKPKWLVSISHWSQATCQSAIHLKFLCDASIHNAAWILGTVNFQATITT